MVAAQMLPNTAHLNLVFFVPCNTALITSFHLQQKAWSRAEKVGKDLRDTEERSGRGAFEAHEAGEHIKSDVTNLK